MPAGVDLPTAYQLTTVLNTLQDPSVSFEFSASLMEIMPRGKLLAVDQSGHLPQWEQPAIVHRGLIDFLRQVNESQP